MTHFLRVPLWKFTIMNHLFHLCWYSMVWTTCGGRDQVIICFDSQWTSQSVCYCKQYCCRIVFLAKDYQVLLKCQSASNCTIQFAGKCYYHNLFISWVPIMAQLNETETQILHGLWNINNVNYGNTEYKNLPHHFLSFFHSYLPLICLKYRYTIPWKTSGNILPPKQDKASFRSRFGKLGQGH